MYDAYTLDIQYFHYEKRNVTTLKLVEVPNGYNYSFKYADRSVIDQLYNLHGDVDDILMTKAGWIMDSSYANIAFEKNGRWYTPSIPLLAGTTWKRLIQQGKIIPQPIHQDELKSFTGFRIFNAMMHFDEQEIIFVKNIG